MFFLGKLMILRLSTKIVGKCSYLFTNVLYVCLKMIYSYVRIDEYARRIIEPHSVSILLQLNGYVKRNPAQLEKSK